MPDSDVAFCDERSDNVGEQFRRGGCNGHKSSCCDVIGQFQIFTNTLDCGEKMFRADCGNGCKAVDSEYDMEDNGSLSSLSLSEKVLWKL